MSIKYYCEDVPFPKLKRRLTTDWIKSVIAKEGKVSGDISFVFCSDAYLLNINISFLKHNFFTDVVTFDYVVGNQISGDIFISIDRVAENASEFNTSIENELNRVMVHGTLHLLGYKDKNEIDKLKMTEKEDYYIKVLLDC
ncbi:MAG: rRNA maturation RNase YbeY [Bacteroidia bacterium]|jgi:probable rRNA maturation factor